MGMLLLRSVYDYKKKEIGRIETSVLCRMAFLASENGKNFWQSPSDLAKDLRISLHSVEESLELLIEKGFIVKDESGYSVVVERLKN